MNVLVNLSNLCLTQPEHKLHISEHKHLFNQYLVLALITIGIYGQELLPEGKYPSKHRYESD